MPRPKKRTSRWLALAAVVTLTACSGDPDGESVQEFMESAGRVDSIVVSDIYEQPVSEVVIACAYTPASAIRQELGFNWSGARSLADWLMTHDEYQAVIALHDGEVVEVERLTIDVLSLCETDLDPATIDVETTLTVSWSGTLTDGTTYPVASIG